MEKALFDDIAHSYDKWYETPIGRAVDLVERKAIEEFFVPSGRKVLEIGCGTGLYTVWLAEQGCQVTAVDVSREMMDQARKKVEERGNKVNWIHGDITEYLDDLGSFDGILSMTAFEFIPEPENVLRKLYEKLNPGGCLVIGVIGDDNAWSKKYREAASLNPQSVFNQARFFRAEEIEAWRIGTKPEIRGVLYFPPDAESFEDAIEMEQKVITNPGFIVVRWKK